MTAVHSAQSNLTRRESEVAQLVSLGLTSREVGEKLGIGERAVEGHVQNILNKLGFSRRTQIAAWVVEQQSANVASLDQRARRHNLPSHLSSFIGRASEVAELEAFLPETRLLTLTGPGGVGKTRLALKVATDVSEHYREGVWLVELAAIAQSKLIVRALATAVGVRETPGRELLESITERLASWQALMVLDNCEHLLGAVAHLSVQLLTSCPDLRLLATSREALRVAGEMVLLVPPLGLPDDPRATSVEAVADSEAVRLFVERGRLAEPHFRLNADNAAPVAAICRNLDGLPLAIELAAARLPLMSPAEILGRLDKRFQILTGGSRTALPRQKALAATVDWSYDLLSQDERILLQRLSVFNGGFTADAAENVCCDDVLVEDRILPLLLSLVERSLVSAQHLEDGRTRYRLLETVRHYSLDRLKGSVGAEKASRRHAEYFQSLADRRMRDFKSGERGWALPLEEELDNLRSAFDWGLKFDPEISLRITATLSLFWWLRGYFAEGLDRSGSALRRSPEKTALRALALAESATFFCRAGLLSQGKQNVDEAIAIARATGNGPNVSWIFARCGMVTGESLEDLDWARDLLTESLEVLEPTGDPIIDRYQLGAVNCWLGWLDYLQGDLKSAVDHSRQSLAIFDEGRAHRFFHVVLLDTLAWVAADQGDYPAARAHWEKQLTVALDIGSVLAVGYALMGLAVLDAADSRFLRALQLFGAGDKIRESHGSAIGPWVERKLAPSIGRARHALGDQAADLAYDEGQRMSTEKAVAYALSPAGST